MSFSPALAGEKKSKTLKSGSKDDSGQTLLHLACTEGQIDLVKKLLKKKLPINETDSSGWNPFHCACASKNFSLELIGFLMRETNVDVAATTNDGATAFSYLVRQTVPEIEEPFFFQVLTLLLEKGPFLYVSNSKNHEYPLHIAAMRGKVSTMKFLLENGAKIDLRNINDETALHYAVMGGVEGVKLLLANGANKYAVNNKGESPSDLAKKANNTEVMELLSDAKHPPLFRSVRSNKPTSVSMFARSTPLSTKDIDGRTAFMHAATLPDSQTLVSLLKNAPEAQQSTRNFKLPGQAGQTMKPGQTLKPEQGPPLPDLGICDPQGWNVYHYLAYRKGDIETDAFNLLVQKGGKALLDKTNNFGESPLHFAAMMGHTQYAFLLQENGAQTNVLNSLEENPLYYAIMTRHPETAKILLDKSNLDGDFKSVWDIAEILKEDFGLPKKKVSTPVPEPKNKKDKEREKDKLDKAKKEKEKEGRLRAKSERIGSGPLEISGPSQMRRLVHVNADYQWEVQEGDVFELEKCIGQGAYGSVFKALQKETGYVLAIKQVPAGDTPEDIEKEIAVLKRCKDTNIVSYLGCFTRDGKLWILMEFCGCGSLADLLKHMKKESKTMNERQLSSILTHVLNGLMYLHDVGIVHRDLKPANILLNSSGEAKLADFGVSTQLTNTLAKALTTIGTPLYMSPEMIEGNQYDYKADIWSLGVTVIEVCTGKIPFASENMLRAIGLIVSGPAPTLDDTTGKWSPTLHSFVNDACIKDPALRKSASDLLLHEFIATFATQNHRNITKELLAPYFPEIFTEINKLPTTPEVLYSVKKNKRATMDASLAASASKEISRSQFNTVSSSTFPAQSAAATATATPASKEEPTIPTRTTSANSVASKRNSVGSITLDKKEAIKSPLNSTPTPTPAVTSPPAVASPPAVTSPTPTPANAAANTTPAPTPAPATPPVAAVVSPTPETKKEPHIPIRKEAEGPKDKDSMAMDVLRGMLRQSQLDNEALRKELAEWKDKCQKLEEKLNSKK
eukprot:TRINITY_DN2523_c0_g1_i4.p1 TRINITY_DN2523_c0_g1~~TRINITY_DN2523_c0_g1_i4.p1  ORF type:complete len:1020 (+),score=365.09 TRINITY_DN2523_c0_g1_i4:65-3124(+)